MLKKFNKRVFGKNLEKGAAALEYVLVTMFGLAFSIAAIAFVADTMGKKFKHLEESLGVEFDISSLNPFAEDGS